MHLSRLLVTVLMGAQMAHAAPATNNPKPSKPEETPRAELPKPPAPPSAPTQPPAQNQFEGIGRIDQITRSQGGEIYRLELSKTLPLVRLEVKSKLGRLKVYSTTLVTDKNERIPVRQLAGVNLDESGQAISSEILPQQVGFIAIEVLTEAMGGEASLEVKAFSTKEAPKLSLGSRVPDFSCKRSIDALLKDKLDPVQMWVARAEQAAPGSVQEKFAGNQLKEQVKDFIATMRTGGTYVSTNYLLTLMNFFVDQYNSVRAGGVSEPAYRDMLQASYDILLIAIQNELPCRRFPSDSLIKISSDFYKKFQGMDQNAKARALFGTITTKIRDFAPEQYRKEVAAANLSFRDADNEGTKYYRQFLAAKDDDFLKTTNRNMSAYAYVVAEQALKNEVKMMDIEQRYQLIVEYQAKYNANTDFPQAVAGRYLSILSEQTYGFRFFR